LIGEVKGPGQLEWSGFFAGDEPTLQQLSNGVSKEPTHGEHQDAQHDHFEGRHALPPSSKEECVRDGLVAMESMFGFVTEMGNEDSPVF
jgi:hypothetical protein